MNTKRVNQVFKYVLCMNVMEIFSKWEYYVYLISYIENNYTWVGNAQEN